ncbi:MAG TPA: sugar ABC transporter ATP-binding protein [Solirubrobacteraceae bacterium]
MRAGAACSVRGIHKRYGAAVALDDVSLDIAAGEIHALVGENGAGKSTLGKVVAGAVAPDAGEILVDGEPVSYRSPRDAIRYGIGLIEQEFALAPDLSVLDNVFLGVEPGSRGLVDRTRQRERFAELAERIGFRERPAAAVRTLRTADQQKVEIMRQLVRDTRLIVMDEPTAALTRDEADRLLALTRELRDEGVTVIYVSHLLGDVLALCDTVTVLKDGRRVKTSPAAEETSDSLVTAMLGRSLDVAFPDRTPPPSGAPVVLSLRDLSRPPAFHDISFDVRAGEIVGLAGLVGSGRTEIARAIFGADPASGTIAVDGRELRSRSPRSSIRRGVALLPESRKDQGLVMVRPLGENVTMAHLGEVTRRGVLQRRREHRVVGETLRRVDARTTSQALPVSSLSGGNQQKAALAKWLVKTPRLLLADEPTRGIDVGAKRAIYDLIRDLAAGGLGVLLISSELEEVLGLAHRVIALRAGRIVGEYTGADADEATVMRAVFGSV